MSPIIECSEYSYGDKINILAYFMQITVRREGITDVMDLNSFTGTGDVRGSQLVTGPSSHLRIDRKNHGTAPPQTVSTHPPSPAGILESEEELLSNTGLFAMIITTDQAPMAHAAYLQHSSTTTAVTAPTPRR